MRTDVHNGDMASYVALLRGVNLGATRRLPMAALRALLHELGFADARTYLASGNVLLSTSLAPAPLERKLEQALAERFGMDVPILVRSAGQLADVVARNPLPEASADGARYYVVFLRGDVPAAQRREIEQRQLEGDRCVFGEGVIYAWYRAGMHASRLAPFLRDERLGVLTTARNWNTVTKLVALASD